jgi:DNA mismatch repair ATPase MutS
LKEPHVDTQDVLVLANHSLKQLNILDGEYSGECSSVLKLLNVCKTRIGQREMERIILKPTRNIKFLQDSYDMIEHALLQKYSWTNLNQIKDIEKIIRKMLLARATPLDYYYLYDSCSIIKDIISGCDAQVIDYVHAKSTLEEIERIQSSILLCLNLDVCKNINSLQFDKFETHELIVKGYNVDLDTIIETTRECETKIKDIVNYLNELYLSIDKKTKDAVKILK